MAQVEHSIKSALDEKITPQRCEGVTIPDRPKTPYEQRWDAMSDLQKMQLQGLLEHYSNEYQKQMENK